MGILLTILFIVVLGCIEVIKEGKKPDIPEDQRPSKKGTFIAITIMVVAIIGMVVCLLSSTQSSSPSKWESLSDEEKDWYERNYGDGKSEAIDKAISDYENSH